MSVSFHRSLRARLIISAAIWIVVGVSAAGIFIAALFRQYASDRVEVELRKHLEELVTLVNVDADGRPQLYRPLSDPLFSQIGSGLSWQVSRSGESLIKSLSASTDQLPVPEDALAMNELRKLTLTGAHGPMIVFERMFLPEGGTPPPFRAQINAEFAVVDRILPTFNIPLTLSLALLALALIAAAALQVSFGLKPMSRLRRSLGVIGSGKAEKLPGDFPSEVQPLVDDLNTLIEINRQIVLRARAQAGNLAHALKTPLAVLIDEAYRLQGRGDAESAAVILQQSQLMQRQIDYQLARARAAASRSLPGMNAVVAPAVANIVTAMKRLHGGKNLQIDVDVNAGCVALCDPMDLDEMLANLIDNACKWGTHAVAIRGFRDGSANQVVIAIDDDGPGLPPESIDVVFRVGERLDEQVPGSGLGLAIVRDLAQLYGGEIQLERSTANGLSAILKLPQARPYP